MKFRNENNTESVGAAKLPSGFAERLKRLRERHQRLKGKMESVDQKMINPRIREDSH